MFKKSASQKTISKLKVKLSIDDYGIRDQFRCAFYCRAAEDILMRLLQQCFLFFIGVVILGQ